MVAKTATGSRKSKERSAIEASAGMTAESMPAMVGTASTVDVESVDSGMRPGEKMKAPARPMKANATTSATEYPLVLSQTLARRLSSCSS